ncbi:MAG: Bro-N domain-containing protein [Lentisphaeria bacterium]|nr:Bro-N domain-containing protein [Lentisphaeria bacterium]
MSNSDEQKSLVVFQNKSIRRIMVDNEWFFSVIDVIAVLTDSVNPRDYWFKMKKRVHSEAGFELSTICRQLKLPAPDGKMRTTDCANVKGMFRIIQSIPSPKAEPFKQWLAQVGYDRVLEIENPELAQERMKELYEQKGYPKDWIDKRLRGIAIRQNLTDEWKARGVTEDRDFAILTAEISKATFGMTPSAYKAYKGLDSPNQNLRDHMTDLELIFTMLGERVTTELSRQEKPVDMPGHKSVARRGGKVAGNARKETEKELGHSIISPDNFLPKDETPELLPGEDDHTDKNVPKKKKK